MDFYTWLRSTGRGDRTARSYDGAINNTITTWAIEAGLRDAPITQISGPRALRHLQRQLDALPAFVENDARGNGMYSAALNRYHEYLIARDIADDITEIQADPARTPTQRLALVKARIGQGGFRRDLLAHWGSCAVTGYSEPTMLVASHIKPWRSATDTERLDPFNGLLLIPNLDRAFDQGLISFQETGEITIAPSLPKPAALGIVAGLRIRLGEAHQPYLRYHRENVFER